MHYIVDNVIQARVLLLSTRSTNCCLATIKTCKKKSVLAIMGNVAFSSNSRKTVCKLLNLLPNFLFPKTNRMSINPVTPDWKKEAFEGNMDSDSTLELSMEAEIDSSENKTERRQTICGSRLTQKEEIKFLKEEVAVLRKQMDQLMLKEENAVPIPPPLPKTRPNFNTRSNSTPKDYRKQKIDILKDIRNVKLKPITHRKVVAKKQGGRNDLHEILKKRFTAMHSPHSCRNLTFEEEGENQDSFSTQDIC